MIIIGLCVYSIISDLNIFWSVSLCNFLSKIIRWKNFAVYLLTSYKLTHVPVFRTTRVKKYLKFLISFCAVLLTQGSIPECLLSKLVTLPFKLQQCQQQNNWEYYGSSLGGRCKRTLILKETFLPVFYESGEYQNSFK